MTMLDMGGTMRARSVEDTLDVLKPYAKKAGISRIADLTTLDEIGLPVYTCIRPNSKSLSTSQGKGISANLAKCSAYMEAIEHYYMENYYQDLYGSYDELKATHSCVDPKLLQSGFFTIDDIHKETFDWTEMRDLKSNQTIYIPSEFMSFDLAREKNKSCFFKKTTTGVASGNNRNEATCHSLLEIIERESMYKFRKLKAAEQNKHAVDLDTIDYPPAKDLLKTLKDNNVHVIVFDMALKPGGIPAYNVVFCDNHPLRKMANFSGHGAHIHQGIAVCRALTEAAQSRLTFIAGSRDDIMPAKYKRSWTYFDIVGKKPYKRPPFKRFHDFDEIEQFLLTKLEYQYVLQRVHTQPDDEIAVVQTVVPGLSV